MSTALVATAGMEQRIGAVNVEVAGAPWGDAPVSVLTLDAAGYEREPVVERDGARHVLQIAGFERGVPVYVYDRPLGPHEPAPPERFATAWD